MAWLLLVPTLRVGTPVSTAPRCVGFRQAGLPRRRAALLHSHAERGNEETRLTPCYGRHNLSEGAQPMTVQSRDREEAVQSPLPYGRGSETGGYAMSNRSHSVGVGLSLRLPSLLAAAGLAFLLMRSLGAVPAAQPNEITNSIGMKLALIPAGKFIMGSPKDEKDRWYDEEQHEVSITKPFYLGVYVVTQAEYEKVMGNNPSYFSPKGGGKDKVKDMDTGQFPVETVSWDDAVAFCKKLSELPEEKKAGRVYRLPTEAEWEYACRAGTKTAFHYGNSLSSKQANFNGNLPYGGADKGPYLERTAKVGSYAANAFGLYDMHGNVWEWCQDWYDENYYKNSPREDPPGPTQASYRVVRGGCWIAHGGYCRSANRNGFEPGFRNATWASAWPQFSPATRRAGGVSPLMTALTEGVGDLCRACRRYERGNRKEPPEPARRNHGWCRIYRGPRW